MDASSAHLRELAATVWRGVEAQHVVSTMRLVGNRLDDQLLLERLLDDSKPRLPSAAEGLHWLLATPFRYRPRPPGSRFRGPYDPGAFYAAFERRTACAEVGYWRWRFVQDSEGLSGLNAQTMSLFEAAIDTPAAVDLTESPLVSRRACWTDPADYGPTQAFARSARAIGATAIVYESVRDPESGSCLAVLDPAAFVPGQTPPTETWYLTITPEGAVWQRPGGLSHAFVFA